MILFVNSIDKVISILMSIISANILTQREFGLLNFYISLATILAVIFSFGTQGVYFREASVLSSKQRLLWKDTITLWYSISVILVFFGIFIYAAIFSSENFFWLGVIYISVILTYVSNLFVTDALYTEESYRVYSAYLLKFGAVLIISGMLFNLDTEYRFKARIYSESLVGLICLVALFDFKNTRIHKNLKMIQRINFKKLSYFGYTMLAQASLVVFLSSDRILLAKYIDIEAVSNYSVLMYGLMPVFLVSAMVSKLSKLIFVKFDETNLVHFHTINLFLLLSLPVAIIIYIGYSTLGIFALHQLLPQNYDEAVSLLPLTSSVLLMNYIYLLSTRALHALRAFKLIFTLNALGIIINCFIIIIFSPSIGYVVGLTSTFFAYLAMTIIALLAQIIMKQYEFKNIALNFLSISVSTLMIIGV